MELAVAQRPLDVLGIAIDGLHLVAQVSQLDQLLVGQTGLLAMHRGDRYIAHPARSLGDDHRLLVRDLAGYDLLAPPIYYIMIGRDPA